MRRRGRDDWPRFFRVAIIIKIATGTHALLFIPPRLHFQSALFLETSISSCGYRSVNGCGILLVFLTGIKTLIKKRSSEGNDGHDDQGTDAVDAFDVG